MKHVREQTEAHYVVDLYSKLHLIPEKAFQEYETAKLVSSELSKIDFGNHRERTFNTYQ